MLGSENIDGEGMEIGRRSRTLGTGRRLSGTLAVISLRSDLSLLFSALVTFTLSCTSASSTWRVTLCHCVTDTRVQQQQQPYKN